MAEPPGFTSGAPRPTVDCPQCGSPVTADSAQDGDRGKAFRCSNCGKLFGIVPGISEPSDAETPTETPPAAG